jgi:hypothetical protein
MNRFVILIVAISSGFALIPSSFSAVQNPGDAVPAPTPPLQWVNSSTAQINNNVPITEPPPTSTPEPRFPNQQAQLYMQQQQQVPDVQLPYPLETGTPSP